MIARLEKEKQTLEIRLGRSGQCGALTMKCCRMPSCPNLQHRGNKYTTSESPETYTGASSECSSPAHSAIDHHKHLQQTSQLYTRDGRIGGFQRRINTIFS
ncbi:unnamed protein product [Ceratitis capitata]|uniref:(Mediterranean fruit fly) hypothetical protein n=1 Tax=Ceratitis capitata TaxID=7213 RepID=A0A811V1S8_CERCA|nr:unnamed protein product [Ceratitis capitata]